ncbi:MAG: AsmA family protein [Candidatus Rokubacteria bacterium]|nr:AsmA family protein [Candidatus Rokubacteria bacterium]
MRRYAKWVLAAFAALVVLVVAALAALPLLVDTPRVQSLIATSASQALGRPVTFASVSVTVFPLPAVELRGLEVADDPKFDTAPFLKLERGELRLRLRPLLSGRVEFGELVLRQPRIALIQSADGRLNVSTLGPREDTHAPARPGRGGGGAGAPSALVSRVRIDKGVVTYVVRGAATAAPQYRIEDLDLTLTGGGPRVGFDGSLQVRPGDLALRITEGALTLDGGKSLLDAPVRARVALEGRDLGSLAANALGPTPAIGGAVKGTLAVAGTLGQPTASGEIELAPATLTQTNAQCPEPRRRTLTLATLKVSGAWQDSRLTGRPLTSRLASGTITANVTASLDRGVRIGLGDLAIRGLPLERVLVDFLCQGYAVSGPLDLDGALSLTLSDLWTTLSGPGRLRIGPGRVVGAQALGLLDGIVRVGGAVSALLSADLPSSLFAAPLEFESITGTYQITNGVLTTRDLLYTSRAMKVAVAGEYGLATGRMNLDVVMNHGRGEVKAKVTGTAASPSIRVVPSTILREADPKKVEQGLQDLLKRFR